MNRVRTALSVTVFALIVNSAAAQTRPDFSGRWTSEPEPAGASQSGGPNPAGSGQRPRPRAGDMGSGWGTTITITQDTNRLTVEYAYFTTYDMQPPLKFVYALDGSETKNSFMMGRGFQAQASRTAWDGEKLIITTAHDAENPTNNQPMKNEMKQVLWLESPSSLIVETTRSGVLGGPPSTVRTVYRKLTARAGGV